MKATATRKMRATQKNLHQLAADCDYESWWHLRAAMERGFRPLVGEGYASMLEQCGYDDSGIGPGFRRQSLLAAEVDAAIDALAS